MDTSASMRRSDLWNDATKKLNSVFTEAAPGDQLSLFTFDRGLRPLVTFEEWNNAAIGARAALVQQRIASISPGWASTHVGDALMRAAELLSDTGTGVVGARKIVLISDLQEGSRLDQLQGYEWPKGIEVLIHQVKPRGPNNASIQLTNDSDDPTQTSGMVRFRVVNATGSRREQFKVGWKNGERGEFIGKPLEIYVPAGQTRLAQLQPPTNHVVDRATLVGDDDEFDNTAFFVAQPAKPLEVVYLGNDWQPDPQLPLFFLQRAFQQTGRQPVHIVALAPDALPPAQPANPVALWVVADALPAERATALREQVTSGNNLLFVITSEAASQSLAQLLGLPEIGLKEAQPPNYALLGHIDFRNPLFGPFADARFSDFTKIHFWKYRRLDTSHIPEANVLAKFDNGDAALVEIPIGKGRVFVLTSGWHPRDSQLALSTKFVPLLYGLIEQGAGQTPMPNQYRVGDSVPLAAATKPGGKLTIVTPNGSSLELPADASAFTQTDAPGIYQLPAGSSRFVVNLDASESRTAPLAEDQFEKLGVPLEHQRASAAQAPARKVQLHNDQIEAHQKLWRWLLLGAVLMLLLETWLAGKTARRIILPAESTV
jgi:hypothetical protein